MSTRELEIGAVALAAGALAFINNGGLNGGTELLIWSSVAGMVAAAMAAAVMCVYVK